MTIFGEMPFCILQYGHPDNVIMTENEDRLFVDVFELLHEKRQKNPRRPLRTSVTVNVFKEQQRLTVIRFKLGNRAVW